MRLKNLTKYEQKQIDENYFYFLNEFVAPRCRHCDSNYVHNLIKAPQLEYIHTIYNIYITDYEQRAKRTYIVRYVHVEYTT